MSEPLSEAELAAIREREAAATKGPWFTVGPPWRNTEYGTYVIAGHDDPHIGEPVLDCPEIFEWAGDAPGPDYAQSNCDLEFAAHAREDIPRLLATLAARDAALAAVMAERDEARAERRDLMATIEEVAPGVIVAFDADASAAVRDLVEAGDRLAEIVDDAMPYSVALAAWRALTRGEATDGR